MNHMTKLYAVLVGSLLLAGGSSAMARPDADDTLTQIHRLPNEIIGAAELKPVFRFGRRLQDGVSTLSGVQEDGLVAGKNKAEAAEAELKAAFEKADAITEAELKAKAELKAALEEAEAVKAKAVESAKAEAELKAKAELKAALEEAG